MKYMVFIMMLVSMAFCITAEMSETYRIGSGTELEVNNINGDITIERIDGNNIIIDIVKKTKKDRTELEKVTVDITSGETFVVKTRYLEDNVDVSVDIALKVPDNIMEVAIENVNGTIDIEGITAEINIDNANGDITVTEVNGTVEVDLANGDVRIEGDAIIEDVELANGSISAEVRALAEDGAQFELANGTIRIYILESLNADIEARIVMGNLKVHDLSIDYTKQKSNSIEGTLNDGGPLIEIGAATGNISIYRLKD